MKNVIKPLAKSVLIPLGLTAAGSGADTGIHKKILGSGNTTLIISNDGMKNIIKKVKSLEYSGLLLKGVSKTIQNDVKEQKEGFLSMFLYTLGPSLLGNILAGKGLNRDGEGFIRADYGPLINFKIQNYYQNEPRFNGVYYRDNLPKTKFQEKINDVAWGICNKSW